MKKTFGNFQTLEPIVSFPGKAVYKARSQGSDNYVIKVTHLAHFTDGNSDKVKELADCFCKTVALQKRVAEENSFVGSILDFGVEDELAWEATKFHSNSLQKLINSRQLPTTDGAFKIIDAMVQGTMAFRDICGRSHGNIRSSNVLFNTSGKNQVTDVVIEDPAAGEPAQVERFELADLRAIGELIYRMVHPSEHRPPEQWKIDPTKLPAEWVTVFGAKHAPRWATISAKLLDPKLNLSVYNLDKLALELTRLNPKRGVSPVVLAGAAAGLLLLGAAGGFAVWKHSQPQKVVVADDSALKIVKSARAEVQAEAAKLAEQKILVEAKVAAEAKAAEELRLKAQAELRAAEETRKKAEAEAQRLEEDRKSADAKVSTSEQERLAAAQKAEEALRIAKEAEERAKKLVEEKVSVEKQLAEETRKKTEAEAKRLAEEKQKAELRADAEQKARLEASRKAAEAERLVQEADAQRRAAEQRARELSLELARKEREAADKAREETLKQLAAERERAAAAKSGETLTQAKLSTPTISVPVSGTSKPGKGLKWSNSLGMRFAPVGDGSVLFCIWETRYKDYEEFVRAARYNGDQKWKSPGFTSAPASPVVNVNWSDAEAFCKWLTDSERSKGAIDAKQFYRLPTDTEWSFVTKASEAKGSFSWGASWPPPIGVGNFASVCSYDRFEATAPSGQFPANEYGVFDLLGNVWELCETRKGAAEGVARGGSWMSASPEQLSISYRLPFASSDRREDVGFRVVLDLGTK